MTTSPQILSDEDIVGTWGFDTGYQDRPDEVRIRFAGDGTGTINPHADAIDFTWKYEAEEGLSMRVADHWYGAFRIQIIDRDLPLGRFTSLISSGPLLPFGLSEFQKMHDSSEAPRN
jgi:hypothetical protein